MRRKRTFRALLSTQAPLSLRDPPSDAGGPSSRCHPVAASSLQSGARGALAAWAGACAHARSLDGPAVARSATYAKHTELTAAPPPGLAPAPHGTSRPPAARCPPPATHRETLVPQTSVGAARRPRPLLLPGWGGAGATTPGAGPRSAGLEPKGGRGLQTDQSLRLAPSGRPRASRKGRRGCFKAPGGKPENRAGRQGQGWPSAAWTAREQEEFAGQAHPLGAEARSRQRAETPRGELDRSPWPGTKARGRSPSWSLAGPPHFGIRPLAAA